MESEVIGCIGKKPRAVPDIAFPKKKVAIFINGCFWHRCPYCNPSVPKTNFKFWKDKFDKNVKRDLAKVHSLENMGWFALTIWECQLKEDPKKFVHKIIDFIKAV